MREHLWALVLAGGEGRRIRHLTTDASGRSVPKQYASLDGDESRLRKTLNRAERIVPREQVAVVVARHHRDYWSQELADMPRANVIVQPRNRGTGTGLLLGVLRLRQRDPRCEVLVLPSDHHVSDEGALRECLLRAAGHAWAGGRPTLVGVSPERDGGELGWIVAGDGASSSVREVVGFVEKPEPSVARRLISQGALVNSMILAAGADALLGLFQDAAAPTVESLGAFMSASEQPADGLDALYETLPTCDFSRDVLERATQRLAVVATPPCGWTDIGTPARLSGILCQAADGASRMAPGGEKIRGPG
jgi:mannose-1-phosphate guanylyltransferase